MFSVIWKGEALILRSAYMMKSQKTPLHFINRKSKMESKANLKAQRSVTKQKFTKHKRI